jgi:hypothetical protein
VRSSYGSLELMAKATFAWKQVCRRDHVGK